MGPIACKVDYIQPVHVCCVERFGRRKTILSFTAVKLVGILLALFGPSYTPFVVGRFLMGCGIGSFLPTYVLSKAILYTTNSLKSFIFLGGGGVHGRSRSLMFIFLKCSSPVLVIISSMSVFICNHLYTS